MRSMRIFLRRTLVAAAAMAMAMSLPRLLTGQTPPTSRDSAAAQQRVAVVIFAEATAGEVSFKSQPQLHVRLSGGLDSVHVLDRTNLPSPVVKGTTYRNVHIAVELFGRVTADCIARTLTGGPAGDCASLELRGTSGASGPPAARTARDSTADSTSRRNRPPRN